MYLIIRSYKHFLSFLSSSYFFLHNFSSISLFSSIFFLFYSSLVYCASRDIGRFHCITSIYRNYLTNKCAYVYFAKCKIITVCSLTAWPVINSVINRKCVASTIAESSRRNGKIVDHLSSITRSIASDLSFFDRQADTFERTRVSRQVHN